MTPPTGGVILLTVVTYTQRKAIMFKMILGAGVVVALVGFGVITTQDVQKAGDAIAEFAKDDVKPAINKAANTIVEATK